MSCRSVIGEAEQAKQAIPTLLSQPCPWGAEIMGGNLGKWPAWTGGRAGLGIWPCLRRNTDWNPAFLPSLGGV